MREIKFRGKGIGGDWVYGDLIRHPTDSGDYSNPPSSELTWFISNSQVITHEWYQVIPETVGQYTGLKDKNDKEIYEGDIVKVIGMKKYGEYITEIIYERVGFKLKENKTYIVDYRIPKGFIEVIGNVHEDKELLKN